MHFKMSYAFVHHYNDAMMGAIASQITNLTTVYSTIYSRRGSMKTSKFRVTGLCDGNPPATGDFPAQMRKMFPFDYAIMQYLTAFRFEGLVQDSSNPSAIAMGLLLSGTKPSFCGISQTVASQRPLGTSIWFLQSMGRPMLITWSSVAFFFTNILYLKLWHGYAIISIVLHDVITRPCPNSYTHICICMGLIPKISMQIIYM